MHHGEYTDAYLYAWDKCVYPVMQDGDDSVPRMQHEHYANQFLITKEKVNDVIQNLDQCWLDDAVPTFYKLENQYKVRVPGSGWNRWDLVHICRYLYLNGTFDDEFWSKLLTRGKHHTEVNSTRRKFDRKDNIGFQ
ncbi:hypothetical protein [Ferrimonas kyonanensis]|uniref:hypothetical protein n=1 Tax=Ferrimonas kyonanensis TaxID=364763 RepID=UPI000686523F|nr:hypothetical protein [Ferrimonas kyonanensis]